MAAAGELSMSVPVAGGYGVGEGEGTGEGVLPGPGVTDGWGDGTGVGETAGSAVGVPAGGVTVAPSISNTSAAASRLSWTARALAPAG